MSALGDCGQPSLSRRLVWVLSLLLIWQSLSVSHGAPVGRAAGVAQPSLMNIQGAQDGACALTDHAQHLRASHPMGSAQVLSADLESARACVASDGARDGCSECLQICNVVCAATLPDHSLVKVGYAAISVLTSPPRAYEEVLLPRRLRPPIPPT